ncbi:esterase/lipase family protein [Aliikangiella maris]|uniref:Alpha/beta hydrolase n=2 Tax=Aliikangiella maris TaxID=3162458 RepID=A0ABV2BX68_9GAMM
MSSSERPQAVILHGLGRGPRSMQKIALALEEQGYRVLNANYHGLTENYQSIIQSLAKTINQWLQPDNPIHFVGHSFGGILIRGLLAAHPEWKKGRCVMLGSPNKGTQTASFMLSHWWFKHFVPPVTADLTPDSQLIDTLPEPDIETGIIAGNVKFSLIVPVSWYYKKATDNAPGDGVVELSNTQCSTMTDFIVMPLHHSFMMWDSELIHEVLHFLAHGRFSKAYQPITS